MDELTSQLVRTTDAAARIRTFGEIQRIWAREMPAIPIVVPNVLVGWKKRIGNVRPSILVPHLLWNAEELTAGTAANR